MILKQVANTKTSVIGLLNLRQETLVKESDTAGLEALKTFLKALNNTLPINLSSLKYGFTEEKQEFFCVAVLCQCHFE